MQSSMTCTVLEIKWELSKRSHHGKETKVILSETQTLEKIKTQMWEGLALTMI